ncbi:gustatory receptor for sugar taste 64a-like [Uranotaenia lowii]|uniref:gustatory receptor for sugar taste 64a-like n=1 Tax=Uranotaenia lowii TaxID=190385 RepID=UPI00247A45F0|nr:gustatory receptor for sugar taste 64a-like [Uranotaenia lowii]
MSWRTFNTTMVPAFVSFQMFGFFPVTGILGSKTSIDLRFRWWHPKTLFSVLIALLGMLMCYVEYRRVDRTGVNAGNLIGVVFYADTVVCMALMLKLARKWRSFALMWDQYELSNSNDGNFPRIKIITAARWFTIIFVVVGLIEHFLSKINGYVSYYEEAAYCNWSVENFPKYFASRRFGFLFKHIRYNLFLLLFFEYCNVALTLTWTGMDLTIVLVSFVISCNFHWINSKLSPFKDGFSIAREGFWIEIREQYVQVCCLVNKASELLAPMIIHSCATNIYLICYAFLTFTWAETGTLTLVNHWFSLFFMIGKTVLMFYSASMVNETSKYPLKTCTAVPNIGWCIELDRFVNQLRTHRVALSAMGFFDLTKRTMLALAGTVITYELVMLNFAKDTAHVGNVIPCSRLAFSRDD